MRATTSLKKALWTGTAFAGLAFTMPGAALAQATDGSDQPEATLPQQPTTEPAPQDNTMVVTGSRLRQDPNNSALPLQVIRNEEISRNGISSPEQLLMFLPSNASGADNLASNADVVSGAQRGTNGLSSANLRGQGNSSTLVLLNGRAL